MDTVEFGLMTFNRKNVSSTAALGRFLTYSFANSPLRVTSGGSGGSDDEASGSSSSSFRASPVDVSIAGDSNAGVQGIGGGVQGMLATGNALSADNISASLSGAQQRIRGIKSFGAGVLSHDVVIELAVLQWIGFTIGSLLVFYRLRALSYCDDCQVLLSRLVAAGLLWGLGGAGALQVEAQRLPGGVRPEHYSLIDYAGSAGRRRSRGARRSRWCWMRRRAAITLNAAEIEFGSVKA
jgi:hypothetical protein